MEIKEFIENFADVLEIENIDSLSAETEFRNLNEWSSLSIILLIAFYDETFDKEISGENIKSCKTIQDLFNLANS